MLGAAAMEELAALKTDSPDAYWQLIQNDTGGGGAGTQRRLPVAAG